ncbi:hypothetical protein CF067_12250 [Clostridium sporogenes]
MKIDAHGRKIREILERKICYEIPDYQRPYSWTTDEIDDLFNDLDSTIDGINKNHFFGAFVFNSERKEKEDIVEVIDGQQRLTTLMLVFYAIRKIYNEDRFNGEKGIKTRRNNVENLLEFLDDDGEVIGIKLKLGEANRTFFTKYIVEAWNKTIQEKEGIKRDFKNKNNLKVNKPMIDAYDHICQVIYDKIKLLSNSQAYNYLKKYHKAILDQFEVVEIEVENDVDAFLIFETLNDRGLELSAVDLIKNKLFKNCSMRSDFEDIKNKWTKILGTIDDAKEVKKFIRHYWISKYNFVSTQQLFKEVRDYVGNDYEKSKEIINDLYRLAPYYDTLRNPNDKLLSNKNLIEVLHYMKALNFDLNYPILLSAFNKYPNDEENIYKIAKLTLNFLIRYICVLKKKPSAIEKIFGGLARELNIEKISTELIKYAKDSEFKNGIKSLVVKVKSYSTYYLLVEYEKNLHKNEKWISPGRKNVTIEHILPQTVDEKKQCGQFWIEAFDNSKEQCEICVNRLGNLTLLGQGGQNKASNKNFNDKKEIYINYTDMFMTKELLIYNKWNSENIEIRQNNMSEKYVDIFTLDLEKI